MKPFDAVIVAVVFLTGLAGTLVYSKASGGSFVEIRTPSSVSRYSLAENREIEVDGKVGVVKFEISDHKIRCVESSCPDKICVEMGWKYLEGDSIICVPNGVIARITGGEAALDAIAE